MKDNTCGITIRAKVDHLDPIGQVDISRGAQFKIAGYDSLDACIFASFDFSNNLEVIPSLLNVRYGWDTGIEILEELGRESLKLEREFNR